MAFYASNTGRFFRPSPTLTVGHVWNDLIARYERRCPVCSGRLPDLADAPPIGDYDGIINSLVDQIYNHRIKGEQIPGQLYEQTANDLLKAVHAGLGGTTFGFDDPRNGLLAYFQQNIFQFSGAKSLAELKQFNSLLVDENGIARTFQEFRNACFDAGLQFNKNWLQTEYNTAMAGAQMALNWESLQNADFLEYSTVGDDKVRAEHAILEGFTASPDNPIWNIIYPPCDWNCRCTVIPGLEKNADVVKITKQQALDIVPFYFQHNTGTSKILLDDEGYMQYQAGSGKPKLLSAEKNYGMQAVEDLYKKNTYTSRLEIQTAEDAYKWFADNATAGELIEKDVTGVSVKVDEEMIRHTIEDNADNRFEIVGNIPGILKTPDEIWSYRADNGDLERYYVKYFAEWPIVMRVNDDAGIRAYTMHEAQINGKLNTTLLKKLRRGTLIYRK